MTKVNSREEYEVISAVWTMRERRGDVETADLLKKLLAELERKEIA